MNNDPDALEEAMAAAAVVGAALARLDNALDRLRRREEPPVESAGVSS